MVSEEKLFENVDGRTTDAGVTGILIAHLGAFGSGELKIRGCTNKDTNNSAANYFRQPLLVPNNAKTLHFYQIVNLTNFLTFSLINIYQNIRNKRIFLKN